MSINATSHLRSFAISPRYMCSFTMILIRRSERNLGFGKALRSTQILWPDDGRPYKERQKNWIWNGSVSEQKLFQPQMMRRIVTRRQITYGRKFLPLAIFR